jgi:hypothetical protein
MLGEVTPVMTSHVFGTRQTGQWNGRRSEDQQRNTTDSKALSCPREPGLANKTFRRL